MTKLQKEIKKLARAAHEKEMRHYLELLNRQFSDWRNGKLDTWDLVQQIHEFHNGSARQLFNAWQGLSPSSFLFRAITAGYLSVNELPKEIQEEIGVKAAI